MPVHRKATATWSGTGKEGSGHITTLSGVLNNTPHSFLTRFVSEDGKAGTNPEELDQKAKGPGIDQATFDTCTEDAKVNCPISQVLKSVPITLSAELI
jgi:organic hydroperoxide reductase OsmC/OhrA